MEEIKEVKIEDVKSEVKVEEKKEFWTKKKKIVATVGGTLLGLVALGAAILLKKEDNEIESEGQKIVNAFQADYEPTENYDDNDSQIIE